MKILDLDMDYFLKADVSGINETVTSRLPEEEYKHAVWTEQEVLSIPVQ